VRARLVQASLFSSCLGSVFPSSLIKIACSLVLALTRSPQGRVTVFACLACPAAFFVMLHIAWVQRQRMGVNPAVHLC
jgi:hypothetical protein